MLQPQQDHTFKLSLEAGTHWICACGQSKNFPYCDGGHQGTGLQPIALELDTPKVVEVTGTVANRANNSV